MKKSLQPESARPAFAGFSRNIPDNRSEKLQVMQESYRLLIDNMSEGVAYCRMIFEGERPIDFIYLAVNSAFVTKTGLQNVVGKRVTEVIPGIRESDRELFEIYGEVALTRKPRRLEIYVEALRDWFDISVYSPENEHFIAVFDVITDRKREENTKQAMVDMLKLINSADDQKELLNSVLSYLKNWSGCEAVGIRLKDGDDFPYFETSGFPERFVRLETHLCSYDENGKIKRDFEGNPQLDCMCGNILQGRFDPEKSFFTDDGSFWSNCTTELLATTTDADRQARTRNRCNGEGYESVALIPLRSGEKTFGLIQLNDKRKGRFTSASIAMYEWIANSIAAFLAKKVSEQALRKSEEKYRKLFYNAEVGIYWTRLDGSELIEVNRKFLDIAGATREEIVGKPSVNLWADPKEREEMAKRLVANGSVSAFEFKMLNKRKGDVRNCLTSVLLYREQGILEGSIVDITERKRTEEALRESEEKYRKLFYNAEVGMFRTRLDGSEVIEVNRKFLDIAGATREEIVGKPPVNLWADPKEREEMAKRLVADGSLSAFEFKMLNKRKNDARHCLISVLLYREQGILEGSIVDVTEHKRAEEALRESELRFRTLFSQAAVGVAQVESQTGRVVRINKRYCDIIGYTPDEMDQKSLRDITHQDDLQKNLGNLKDLMEGRIRKFSIEKRYYRKDGSIVWVKMWVSPMWEVGQKPDYHIAVVEDITKLKSAEKEKQELETQLQQSQKMEAVGLLAGGIAHDFNNLLTIIIGNADFALEEASGNASLFSEIEEIRKAGRQAAALTRKLLAFSRKQLIKPIILNLNEILIETEKMLRRTIGEDIEFKTMFEPELWNVKMDQGQIEQILLNVVVNARDAMPTGGKLTIETANVELDDDYSQNHGVKNTRRSYVMIAVTDTGTGMDEETQFRIFEPFFTTKKKDQGTGLGLSTVYGIVKQNNGRIRVYSEPGKGTTFKIYFPRTETDEKSDDKEQLDESRFKGFQTILVAEDSETLLKISRKALEKYGYKVLTARNGNEAMEIFNGHDGPIHLLLADVVMPGMNGRELAEQIRSKSSKIQVIYMSGYTDDAISKHGVLYDDIEFIEKPFTPKDLVLKVREVLALNRKA
jgi:PAS domain S-box-containing protein